MKKTILFFLSITFSFASTAQWNEVQKIVASERSDRDEFGGSVAISGDYAIVGIPGDDPFTPDMGEAFGAALIFEKDNTGNWVEVQKLVAPDGGNTDFYGSEVSISGNYAVMGSYITNGFNGAAYIFERDPSGVWQEVQKITAADMVTFRRFAYSVSIDGDFIILGAPHDGLGVNGQGGNYLGGAAYIFKRESNGNWNQIQKIVSSDQRTVDNFGHSVSISGGYAIIGAIFNDYDEMDTTKMESAGAAYIFEKNTNDVWVEKQKITATIRISSGFFGSSVAIHGNNAIVGSFNDPWDENGVTGVNGAGSAFILERENNGQWVHRKKAVASLRSHDDQFGVSVSISEDKAIIGANYYDRDLTGFGTKNNAGSAFIYEKEGNGVWSETQHILASDRDRGDSFGWSVGIDGEFAIIGALGESHDVGGGDFKYQAGSSYIFKSEDSSGISNDLLEEGFIAWPNPSAGETSLFMDRKYSETRISMFNVIGDRLLIKTVNDTQQITLHLEGNPGIYLVEILPKGGEAQTIKIIKR